MTTNTQQPTEKQFTVPFKISIPYSQVKALVKLALDDCYWIDAVRYNYSPAFYNKGLSRSDIPFLEGCAITIFYTNDGESISKDLNIISIQSGLTAIASKYYSSFNSFVSGEPNVAIADIFLQCCLFGSIIFN
jgi:hypothetical protein